MSGNGGQGSWRAAINPEPNVLLRELNFTARPRPNQPHHYGQINAPLTKEEWKAGFAQARRGELPEHLWWEHYFQSVHDAAVAPAGQHTMSIFARYVPYCFAHGTWDEREEVPPQVTWRA